MLSPQELIGQRVWLKVQANVGYYDAETHRVKAEITQPTAPPWFFARYLDPPFAIKTAGQWMSLYDAQLAVLQDPVIEEDDNYHEDLYEDELDLC